VGRTLEDSGSPDGESVSGFPNHGTDLKDMNMLTSYVNLSTAASND
jgi:hypothetical protein